MINAAFSQAEELRKERAMKLASAVLVGFLSGFMVYTMLWLLFLGPSTQNGSPYLWFILAWAISSCGVYFGAESVVTVWARGALLGAGEWLTAGLIAVILMVQLRLNSSSDMTVTRDYVGAELESGIVPVVAIGGSFSMAIFCLLIWLAANRSKPEFQQRPYS